MRSTKGRQELVFQGAPETTVSNNLSAARGLMPLQPCHHFLPLFRAIVEQAQNHEELSPAPTGADLQPSQGGGRTDKGSRHDFGS